MRTFRPGSPATWLRPAIVTVAVAAAFVQGLAPVVLACGLAVLALDLGTARAVRRSPHSVPRHRLAVVLIVPAAAVAGAATAVQAGVPTGAPLLLLIPAFRAGETCGRRVAALCVLTSAAVGLGTAAVTTDLGPALAAGWLQWGGLALLAGLAGARSASLRQPSAPPRQEPPEPPAAREAALLLRRLDTLAGAIDGGFDAPASAELLLNAVDAAVPARRRAVLVGFGNDPAVPLALRGSDRVPWQDPALDDSVLGRVWRTGRAEYGALEVDGDSRPLLAAALRDPMGDRIGVVVLERAPGTGFDDADLAAVSEVAERHSPNLDVSLIFAALRERAGFEERERLAREMHDGIAQELVALGYRVDVLRRRASTDGSALAGPLDELRHDFSEVLADLRLQIADLRIAVRPDQGLGAVIGARLQRFGSSTGLRVVLRLNESGFRLPAHVETMVYRLLLDILSDARLAPGATAVDVTLDVAPPQVFLRVHHDGTSSLRAEDFREHPMTALGADILVEPHSPAGVVVQMHLRQRSSDGASPLTRERIPQRS